MGIGCTREEERTQAALGELKEAAAEFAPNIDVKSAGVLSALPSLLANGLLKYSQPFFAVTQTANSGLLAVLRQKIVPRLLEEVPHQPTEEELESDRYLLRFGLVFDREGYSPVFFKQMWAEAEQFKTLKKSGKQFIDVIKMIAYRAETAMANILRDGMLKKDEARTLVRQIFMTDADIEPDEKNGV